MNITKIVLIIFVFFQSSLAHAVILNRIGNVNPVFDPLTPQYPVAMPNGAPPIADPENKNPNKTGPQDYSGTLKNMNLSPTYTIQALPLNMNTH